jgi:hypothetical protein
MDVEHFGFLSSVQGSEKAMSKTARGCRVRAPRIEAASGDPAMAFLVFPRLARTDIPLTHSRLSTRAARNGEAKARPETRAEKSAREQLNGGCRAFR